MVVAFCRTGNCDHSHANKDWSLSILSWKMNLVQARIVAKNWSICAHTTQPLGQPIVLLLIYHNSWRSLGRVLVSYPPKIDLVTGNSIKVELLIRHQQTADQYNCTCCDNGSKQPCYRVRYASYSDTNNAFIRRRKHWRYSAC